MNRTQNWLEKAARHLGLRVEVGRMVQLPNGQLIIAQAHFPDLGNASGTLVFDREDPIDGSDRAQLADMRYALSTFGEPLPAEEFDLASYAEMFADWGWTGDETLQPGWMSISGKHSNSK